MDTRVYNRPFTLLLGSAGIAATGYVDYFTGYEVRLFPLYFLPVAYVAWRLSRTETLLAAALSAVVWLSSNWLAGQTYASVLIWPINFFSQLIAFAVAGLLLAEVRQRLRIEQDLSRQDALTRLPNRVAFYEQGQMLLAAMRRSARPITLAYLDLDHFKRINDERGHEEGDRALIETAKALRGHLRVSDLVARLGGDEFAILLPDTGADVAGASLERVRAAIAASMKKNDWGATVSIGATAYANPPETLDAAIRDADALMYRAKENGRNRVYVEQGGTDAY